MNDLRKLSRAVLAPVIALSWFGFIGLYVWFDFNRPHVPDVGTGHIYSINNHGSYAFLTLREVVLLYSLMGLSVCLFFVAIAIESAAKRRSHEDAKKSYEDKAGA
jgi:hypothetical protein